MGENEKREMGRKILRLVIVRSYKVCDRCSSDPIRRRNERCHLSLLLLFLFLFSFGSLFVRK